MNQTHVTRITAVDGVRAIAICLVLIGHVIDTFGGPTFLGPLRHAGNFGVRVFFLISGMLITSLLIKEWQATGKISLKMFYVRRVRRILPAYFVFLFTVGILDYNGFIKVPQIDYLRSLTFTMNYEHSADRAWTLNHLWSLSAEEQFYLVWPLLLLKLTPVRGKNLCVFIIFVVIIVRCYMWAMLNASGSALTREIQAIFDSMALGALIAFREHSRNIDEIKTAARKSELLLLPAGILLVVASIGTFFVNKDFYYTIGQSFTNFGIACCLISITRRPNHFTAQLLSNKVLVYIGSISYSLYLWQQLTLHHEANSWFTSFPQNLILTFAIAACSYHFVEQPFIKKKK